ncbi:sensor histidine kinase [Paenibacillus sp. PR3]|uniref:histidine kinase n=1 Tax=Paenibacillus terricola TaxID=2763503 RepID=A0ABR8N3Q5_9BACL|nr:sensor histidine kinase [Paenibacillus terricola]MBD3922495.1 sensor histidine kinase [Paenibacillus terricola]
MELWTIGNKAGLLLYVILASYFSAEATDNRLLLAYLIYLCLNIAIPIFRDNLLRRLLATLSAAFIIYCALWLNPLFILLLPVNLYEWTDYGRLHRGIAFLLMLVPLFLAPWSVIPSYALAVSLSYLFYAANRSHTASLQRLDDERESLRLNQQRLQRTISENDEFMRQSAYTIKLEERNRLSQQIHDEIGHSMAGALIQMEASRRLLDANKEKAAELLGNAISISKEGLERIRLTLKDMKPRSEELGINRLRLFVDELASRQGMTATLTHEGDMDRITSIQWKVIQQNATEAATNSFKYSEATAIRIHVQVLNRFIKAVVSDNGKGAEKIVKGLGIIGMEERTAALNGTVIVDGTQGFSVTTLMPLGAEGENVHPTESEYSHGEG